MNVSAVDYACKAFLLQIADGWTSIACEQSQKHYAIQIRYPVAESFLQEWDLRKKELAAGIISKSEYTEWKLNWPQTADDCGKHPPKIEWRDNSQAGGTQNNGT